MKYVKRFLPIAILIAAMIIGYFTGLYDYLSFDMIREKHKLFKAYVDAHPVQTTLIFIITYIISTALSVPGAIFLTLFGGYLFPMPLSLLYVVFSATIGASIVFLAARTAIGDILKRKAGPLLNKMEEGFHRNKISYLFFLRLAPIFPFWLVNLAPAFFGVKLWTFCWTTFLGIIPGSFVFTQAGSGIESILDSDQDFSLGTIFTTEIKIALIALSLFALIPVVIKWWRRKRNARQ